MGLSHCFCFVCQIPFEDLVREAKINYENLKAVSYSKRITSNFSKIDTLDIFSFNWVDSLTTKEGPFSYPEILNILTGSAWTSDEPI